MENVFIDDDVLHPSSDSVSTTGVISSSMIGLGVLPRSMPNSIPHFSVKPRALSISMPRDTTPPRSFASIVSQRLYYKTVRLKRLCDRQRNELTKQRRTKCLYRLCNYTLPTSSQSAVPSFMPSNAGKTSAVPS